MPHVVVIGGGASGVLVAAQLLLHGGDVTLLEPARELGLGLAYSTKCPLHLLNVPAANMSALPDDRNHFLRWLERTKPGLYAACSFVPRGVYGTYIQSVLNDALRIGAGQFQHAHARAISARMSSRKVLVETEDAGAFWGDMAILATGNAAPAAWPGLPPEVVSSGRFFNTAWMEGAFHVAACDESLLLLGSGLTAVDALLALRHYGHRGKVYMISRRGLLPQTHVLPVSGCTRCPVGAGLRDVTRHMRVAAREAAGMPAGWREAIDGIRPETNLHWQSFSITEQRRFLRHLRPFWDTHRHRMAPQIGAAVHQAIHDGSLEVLAGRSGSIKLLPGGVQVSVALRGRPEARTLQVERVVNCTGFGADLKRTTNPLLRNLMDQGWLRPDPHRLGALVDDRGALCTSPGEDRPPIYTLGPLRMGTLLESIAIPEIRTQAQDLAKLLMAPH